MRRSIVLLLALAACSGEKQSAWRALPLGTAADIRAIHFADAQHGWIAGGNFDIEGGLIGRTTDGGKSWRYTSGIIATGPYATGRKVEALHFFDRVRGVAATDGGKIYTTSDGGESWAGVRQWTGATDYLFDLEFLDERTGWAAGLDGVLRTADGGETWTPAARETVEKEKIACRAIAFTDRRSGVCIGQHATVIRTSDGGTTWSRVDISLPQGERPDFWDVFFIDELRGWITGDEGTLLQTRDGGSTWTRRELGIAGTRTAAKLERLQRGNEVLVFDAGDTTPGLTIASILFTDAQNGWMCGFFANMGRSWILRSTDGGATWSLDAEIEGEELRRIFASDPQHLWAVGARVRPGAQAIYVRDPASK